MAKQRSGNGQDLTPDTQTEYVVTDVEVVPEPGTRAYPTDPRNTI